MINFYLMVDYTKKLGRKKRGRRFFFSRVGKDKNKFPPQLFATPPILPPSQFFFSLEEGATRPPSPPPRHFEGGNPRHVLPNPAENPPPGLGPPLFPLVCGVKGDEAVKGVRSNREVEVPIRVEGVRGAGGSGRGIGGRGPRGGRADGVERVDAVLDEGEGRFDDNVSPLGDLGGGLGDLCGLSGGICGGYVDASLEKKFESNYCCRSPAQKKKLALTSRSPLAF